jgi:putative addiction module killer protein
MNILEYIGKHNKNIFADWFETLEPVAAAKVTLAIEKMRNGLLGDVKPVGSGVSERRINYGAGYRYTLHKTAKH